MSTSRQQRSEKGNILIESDHHELNLDSFDETNNSFNEQNFENKIEVQASKHQKINIVDGSHLPDVMEASDESDSQGDDSLAFNSSDLIRHSNSESLHLWGYSINLKGSDNSKPSEWLEWKAGSSMIELDSAKLKENLEYFLKQIKADENLTQEELLDASTKMSGVQTHPIWLK